MYPNNTAFAVIVKVVVAVIPGGVNVVKYDPFPKESAGENVPPLLDRNATVAAGVGVPSA
jgi:hypothetical protein